MCGIVGILGKQPAAPRLVEGLKRLAYRGYDSAGVATLVNGHIDRRRAEGKIANLEALLARSPLPGVVGIGHTRWATNGRPSETNAHPHATERVAIVHNGIIENFQALREELVGAGGLFVAVTLLLPRGIIGTLKYGLSLRADARSAAAEEGTDMDVAPPNAAPRAAE